MNWDCLNVRTWMIHYSTLTRPFFWNLLCVHSEAGWAKGSTSLEFMIYVKSFNCNPFLIEEIQEWKLPFKNWKKMNDRKCKFPPPIHLELSITKSPSGQFFSLFVVWSSAYCHIFDKSSRIQAGSIFMTLTFLSILQGSKLC